MKHLTFPKKKLGHGATYFLTLRESFLKGIFSVFCVGIILSLPQSIFSATSSTTFHVNATVPSLCSSVVAQDFNFGTYNPILGLSLPVTNLTGVTVTCTLGTTYQIAFNKGTTSGGSITNRLMTNGTDTLGYNLYTTVALTTVWGDGTTGSTVTGLGTGLPLSTPVYGSINANQTNVPPGDYSDLITVTLIY